MRKLKGNNWNKFSNKMSQKINKIMSEKTIEGIDIETEYKKILADRQAQRDKFEKELKDTT